MLKYRRRLLSVLFASILMVNLMQGSVYAAELDNAEQKIYSRATLEDDFADNHVVVILDNKTSLAVDQFEPSMFPNICYSEIRSLTTAKEAKVQEKMSGIAAELATVAIARNSTEIVTTENIMKIAAENEELNSYNQMLCIELKETGKDKVLDAIAELEKLENVIYAGPDYVISANSTSMMTDTYYNQQWALEKIKIEEAWEISGGSSAVIVAVLDTGIDAMHPDLTDRIHIGLSRDFTSGSANPVGVLRDYNGHGTFVAGIIGAVGNNNEGVVGTCLDVVLVSLQVLNARKEGLSTNVAAAVDFAELNNIPIINYSGGGAADSESENVVLRNAISNYSGLFVCAAGNENLDLDENIYHPGNFDLDNIISVGACNMNDEKSIFSNYGKNNVDIFAPGEEVYSTTLNNDYKKDGGTSFASPYVAGVAALILAKEPDLTVAELKHTILNNVDIVYDANGTSVYGDYCTSGGRLNAYKAVTNIAHLQHTYTYSNRGLYEGHQCTCLECDYVCVERHTWVAVLTTYQCSKCRIKSAFVPAFPDD